MMKLFRNRKENKDVVWARDQIKAMVKLGGRLIL